MNDCRGVFSLSPSYLCDRTLLSVGIAPCCSPRHRRHAHQERFVMPKMAIACKKCGREFEAYPSSHQKFCSRACYSVYRCTLPKERQHNWRGGKKDIPCPICQRVFQVWPWRLKKKQTLFCSYKCRSIWYSQNFSGNKSPQWIDGKSLEPYPPEFNYAIKQPIRNRDVVCQLCGKPKTNRRHDVHHVNYRKNDQRSENLILLCHSCHVKTNHNRPYWQFLLTSMMEEPECTRPIQLKLL